MPPPPPPPPPRSFYFVLCYIFLILGEANTNTDGRVYIVYMGGSTWPGGAPRTDHVRLLNEHAKRKKHSVVQIYNKSFLGFAARLSEEEAKSINERPGVVSVFPDSVARLHTTRSWDFLMSQTSVRNNNIYPTPTSSHSNVCNRSSGGRDTIIGILDSGIWPQHQSFDDKYMGPIPQRWKGICMTGDNSTSFKCNRKVIGARYYYDPDKPGSFTTAMDVDGHGTHVASTAAGMPVYGASYYGLAKGVARGGSPSSRIAVYAACGIVCADSSILKAFDDAIADGVDVISASLGVGQKSFFNDPIAIGAFHAIEKGVIVVASVGNSGPSSGTVENYSPLILSVAATTMDRDFQMRIVLPGRSKVIKGGGINFSGLNKSVVNRIVDGRSVGINKNDSTNATRCISGSLDDAKVKGKIVLCENHDPFSAFGTIRPMLKQGVIGIIMIGNFYRQLTFNFRVTIPCVAVSEADGAQIRSYINSTRNPSAMILPTEAAVVNYHPAPVVATFSSRGPAPGIKNLIKPDVTAPGVAVLAAWTFNDTSEAYPGKEPPLFNLMWGTSMSCPHVSGLAATVKSWHPTWSPSAIRSAIMTTAIPTNNCNAPITKIPGSRATPYDIGAGEISLFGPLWPGLVYETKPIDYIIFLCNLGYNTSMIKLLSSTVSDNFVCPSNSSPDLISDLNYPSIAVSGLMPNVKKTENRTVTNVGRVYSTYTATVEAPAGVQVEVVPNKLQFTKNIKRLSFRVTFILTASSSSEEDLFGSITWSNNFYKVRSPFAVSKA